MRTGASEKISRGKIKDGLLLGCGIKNHFVCKKRTPFAGGGMVVHHAADEFVSAISFFDESSHAEDGDDFAACVESGERT